jgi:hypothetical protein
MSSAVSGCFSDLGATEEGETSLSRFIVATEILSGNAESASMLDFVFESATERSG